MFGLTLMILGFYIALSATENMLRTPEEVLTVSI
jgi:hypothetical protein